MARRKRLGDMPPNRGHKMQVTTQKWMPSMLLWMSYGQSRL